MANKPAPTKSAKRVLCIAYFYPPAGGAGVQRPLKFTKYLKDFGWQPHVLTVAKGCFYAEDKTLVDEIPAHCEVSRAWSLELERLTWLRRYRQTQSSRRQPSTKDALGSTPHIKTSLLQQLGHMRRHIMPDAQIGWLPFALREARRICRTQKIDAIWTTSAPYTCHLIGLLLKQQTKLPWIADFRDAWSDNPMGILSHRQLHSWLEGRVLKHADRVVGVTQDITDFLARRTGGPANKYHVIANGYDADDFAAAPTPAASPAEHAPFVLTMTGSLYGKISALPFYEALAQFFLAHPRAKAHTQVRWVGQMDRKARQDSDDALERLGLVANVEHVGYLSHQQAIAALMQADVLLLLLFAGPGAGQVMTGKVFEYLHSGKPILAMAEGTAAATLIDACKAGIVTHPSDCAAIARALASLYAQRHMPWPKAHGRDTLVARFSRRALTEKLAHLLDAATCSTRC